VDELENWYTTSERMAKTICMPRRSVFRLFPTDKSVQRLDHEDRSYSFNWEEGKQYWWDNIYDPAMDMRSGQGIEVKIVDANGTVDTLAVRKGMSLDEIRDLLGKICDFPAELPMEIIRRNGTTYHWGVQIRYQPTIECTVSLPYTRLNAFLFDGSSDFLGLQLSQIMDVKMPPLDQCQVTENGNRMIVRCEQEPARLEARVIKDHALSFILNGHTIQDSVVSSWWLPYDKEEVMRYGHRLSSDIPHSAADAEFPPEPWPNRVTVRLKSAAPRPVSAPATPVEDNPSHSPLPELVAEPNQDQPRFQTRRTPP
jgi:hypothetical protein